MSDEFLDVINEEDMVLRKETRSAVHSKGLWHRGAHVFLFTEDGRMLIQKRSADRVQSPSLLDCSVSEHVKAGESYEEAAARGVLEEMGLAQVELKHLVKFKMNYGPNDNEISCLFEGKVNPEKVIFDPGEISSIDYLSTEELQKLITHEREKLCTWFVEILNWHFGLPSKLTVIEDV